MWRMDAGGNWTQPIVAGFGITRNIGINHLAPFNGQLYAGVRNDQAGAQVYRSSDGNTWDPVATAGFGDPQNTGVYRLAVFGGQLYAGTSSWTTGHGGEIWRSPTGYSGSWARVVNSGFDNPNHYIMRSSEVHDGYLYFGTQNMTPPAGSSSVRARATVATGARSPWMGSATATTSPSRAWPPSTGICTPAPHAGITAASRSGGVRPATARIAGKRW